jgi:hypothetical protein
MPLNLPCTLKVRNLLTVKPLVVTRKVFGIFDVAGWVKV